MQCVQAKVSLLAHSLGSVLTWDILTAQPRLYHSLAAHRGDGSLAALEALSRRSSPPGGGSPPATALGPRPAQVCYVLVPYVVLCAKPWCSSRGGRHAYPTNPLQKPKLISRQDMHCLAAQYSPMHVMSMQGGGARLGDFQPMTSADLSPEPQERSREQRPETDAGGTNQPAAASNEVDASAPAQVQYLIVRSHTCSMQLATTRS